MEGIDCARVHSKLSTHHSAEDRKTIIYSATQEMTASTLPPVSIIIVNYNGQKYLEKLVDSVYALNYPQDRLEIILVDNGSTDSSMSFVNEKYPAVVQILNDKNNFTRALNRAVDASNGEFVGLLNNDMSVDAEWLIELVTMLQEHPRAGCAGGKIMFTDRKTINSVGHERLPDFYYQDKGFREIDKGQYDRLCEAEGICGGAILYRRACLDDIGPFDEDYIMYFEDVDMAYRCKEKKWSIMYTPKSIVYHVFHGSSGGSNLAYLLCNRNRFFLLARHLPEELPGSIGSSHLRQRGEYGFLAACMPQVLSKLVEHNPPSVVERIIPRLFEKLAAVLSHEAMMKIISTYNILYRSKKPSLGIYDHALNLIGGGQKYAAAIAEVLQDSFDVTILSNKKIEKAKIEEWYGLDLKRVSLEVIELPFYEAQDRDAIDPSLANALDVNPFDAVAERTVQFDIFLNANMNEKVRPLSTVSVFTCHFPDSFKSKYFYPDRYSMIMSSSKYGAGWVKERWGLAGALVLYPSVDVFPKGEALAKKDTILSVARFEIGGSKKQAEMIEAFVRLCDIDPEIRRSWKFVLVGGSVAVNPYLDRVRELLEQYASYPIEMQVNAGLDIVRNLYAESKIFWHACGLKESNPHLVEHFGMTTVEAMQNSCVPVVINGGGQREIVEHGKSGYLFDSTELLMKYTAELVKNPELLNATAQRAFERSKAFRKEVFEKRVSELFHSLVGQEFRRTIASIDDLREYIGKQYLVST